MGTGRSTIQVGAVMWIAGPVQYLIAQLVAQVAWRTPYSWVVNPLSDLGAVRCQRVGSRYPLPRYVCSPLHGVVNASVIALGILLAGGVLLTASCWGSGAASRSARILLIAGAAGSVMLGLIPEDENLNLHVLAAFAGIVVGNCGFVLAGLIRRSRPLGRLRPLTLPLSIMAVTAAALLFTGGIPAGDFGGVERLAVFPLRCWMVIAGIFLPREADYNVLVSATTATPTQSRTSFSASLGTAKDARKIGKNLFPVHRKATISPSAASKD
jgi:hypothetical membrane protein